jgi:hypothetical protein
MIALLNLVKAWRDNEARAEIDAGAKVFMGKPDRWYEDPHWFCENGHVSGNFLKSDEHGDLCLQCHEPVILGPNIGEAAFAPILVKLAIEALSA